MLIDGETRPATEIRETKVDTCLDGKALITCEYQIFTTVFNSYPIRLFCMCSRYSIQLQYRITKLSPDLGFFLLFSVKTSA